MNIFSLLFTQRVNISLQRARFRYSSSGYCRRRPDLSLFYRDYIIINCSVIINYSMTIYCRLPVERIPTGKQIRFNYTDDETEWVIRCVSPYSKVINKISNSITDNSVMSILQIYENQWHTQGVRGRSPLPNWLYL